MSVAKKSKISWELAIKVANRVELKSVKLLNCNCKQAPNCPEGEKDVVDKRTSQFEVNKEEKIIGVFIKFFLNAFGKGVEQKNENSFLRIEATFLLLYSITSIEDLDDRAFSSFAELNGVYNAWPYWREFVQNITSRMQLPTLTIPVFRITHPPSKEATNKKETALKTET